MQPQSVSGFLTSLFSCCAGEQEHPCPLLQATVWYVPAALRIQSLFSALRSVKQTNVLFPFLSWVRDFIYTIWNSTLLLASMYGSNNWSKCFICNYIFQTNKQTNKTNHPDCRLNHSLLVSASNKTFLPVSSVTEVIGPRWHSWYKSHVISYVGPMKEPD